MKKTTSKIKRIAIVGTIAASALFSASYASAGVIDDFLKCMLECDGSCSITGVCSNDRPPIMR